MTEIVQAGQTGEGQDGKPLLESRPRSESSLEDRASLAFFSIEGVGPATLSRLRVAFGSLEAALSAPRAAVASCLRDDGTRERFLAEEDLGALADRALERAASLGARVLFRGRRGWPEQLAAQDFPPVLFVRGALEPGPRVAVVGSREADAYGEELATFFAAGLARRGVAVVSGGARGVDGTAHRAALGNQGKTVVVLGSGVDVSYPTEHARLFEDIIARGGALVSHFPPGTPGVPQNFVVRNRVIAGLSDAVIVARARRGSGALGTVEAALSLGRPVFAVPGDVTCELSAGCNGLLEEGRARALTGLAPVGRALGMGDLDWPSAMPPSPGTHRGLKPRARSRVVPIMKEAAAPATRAVVPADLPQDAAGVLAALSGGARQFDELIEASGLDAPGLANALLRLELMGLCEEQPGKVYVRR